MPTFDPDALHQYVEQARGTLEAFRAAPPRLRDNPDPGVATILERMEATVEALRIAEEELRVQNEELRVQNDELERRALDLERANRRYMDLYDLAPIGYVVTDDQGVITEVNLAAESLLNLPASKLRGKAIVTYVPDRDRAAVRGHVTDAAAGRKPSWRGSVTPAQGSGPPVPVQFAVALYGRPTAPRGSSAQAVADAGLGPRELLWSITNLARMASLESEVRRLDDGM